MVLGSFCCVMVLGSFSGRSGIGIGGLFILQKHASPKYDGLQRIQLVLINWIC